MRGVRVKTGEANRDSQPIDEQIERPIRAARTHMNLRAINIPLEPPAPRLPDHWPAPPPLPAEPPIPLPAEPPIPIEPPPAPMPDPFEPQ